MSAMIRRHSTGNSTQITADTYAGGILNHAKDDSAINSSQREALLPSP